MEDDKSLFRREALRQQLASADEEVSLSQPASFAAGAIIVAFIGLVAIAVIGLNKHVDLLAVGPAVVDSRGALVAAVPSKYENLLTPGLRATFTAEDDSKEQVFVTVGLEEGPSNVVIVRAVRPDGRPVDQASQYGRALIDLGTEPILAKFVPVLETILVPGL